MRDLVHQQAQARPDALALWDTSQRWTYAELDAAVAGTRARLQEEGIQSQSRVALHLPNGAGTVVLFWALWRMGAVAVPLSTRLPAGQVGKRARRVGGQFLVADGAEVLEQAPDGVTPLASEQVVEEAASDKPRSSLNRDRPRERPATIVFTSGSTGTPKAALHTWANHLYSAKGANANVPLRGGDRWLLSLPLYHVGGLAILVRCALAGAAVAIPASKSALSDGLTATGATHVSMVATQFGRVMEALENVPPATLRAVLLGGGPIPEELLQRGYERGWPLHTTYGCTEMASQVTTTAPGDPLDTLQTAGRRLPHRRVRVEEGQILVAGPPLFRGYVTTDGLDDPRTEAGWYPTGDRGWIDASGRLHVQGRLDRTFVSGGENVQPEEIETALERLEGVDRAAVVPVPDAEFGQRPVAFVRTTTPLDAETLEGQLAQTLPGFKIPDAFHSLPDERTADALKLDREQLEEQARMLHGKRASGENREKGRR
jgi:O-succinylbenzoic acid--CoA ligase